MGSWDRVSYEHGDEPAETPPRRQRGPEPRVGDVPRLTDADGERLDRGTADSSGYRTNARDLSYTEVPDSSFENLRRGEAPLGMSPEDYSEMRSDLEKALERDGLTDADVRMQGTAATFYSKNPHKEFFAGPAAIHELCEARREEDDAVDAAAEDTAIDRYLDHGYAEGPRPRDKIFDQDFVVTGLPVDRSDYDIQISSDTLQAKMEGLQRENPSEDLISSKGGHWKGEEALEPNFDGLRAWTARWTERTGRDVNLAGFAAAGPEGPSAFGDDDWIIRRPQR